ALGRPIAIIMLSGDHVSRWAPKIASALRPADRIGIYADDTALVMLPELARDVALACANALATLAGAKHVGLAVLPDDAASADDLISAVRASHKRGIVATVSQPPPASMIVMSPRTRAVLDEVGRVAPSALP